MPFFDNAPTNLAPYHVLTYGALFGSELWNSFVGGIVAFRTLPRPQFATLQSHLFPVYFAVQTALPVVLAITYPGASSPFGGAGSSSLKGVFAPENRWSVLAPLAINTITGAANLLYVGPLTTKVMKERKHQETRDGKKHYDKPPHSEQMQKLNRTFGKLHGISSLLNVAAIIATITYGVTLSNRIQ